MTQHLAFFSAHEEHHKLNLLRHLIAHPESTFFFRSQTEALQASGIFKNDLLIVDRSLTAQSGHIVVAYLNGQFLVRRLSIRQREGYLSGDNPSYKTIKLSTAADSFIWGVVTWVLHQP